MADSNARGIAHGHLDAMAGREVVYCHQCENEWYRDEGGLICPACEGEIIEIVTPESDPRPGMDNSPRIPGIPGFDDIHTHNPWVDDSDPEEGDIEEHVYHSGPGTVTFSQTIRTRPVTFGGRPNRDNHTHNRGEPPDDVLRDFHGMLANIMGPAVRGGPTGRSGHETLFERRGMGPPGHDDMGGGPGPTLRAGFFGAGLGDGGPGPTVYGGRYTYTIENGRGQFRPQDDDPHRRPDDIAALLGTMFQQFAPTPPEQFRQGGGGMGGGGLAGGFPSLLAAIFNPANAVHGDAVYSQEALDRIMSQLMEQTQTSNAPGPASPDAISALPKKKIDDKMLGDDGKGECTVCMDDVHLGDEVVVLPCTHWFHENCASAWLSSHNTCPICRKGIGQEESEPAPPSSSSSRRTSYSAAPTPSRERPHRRLSLSSRPSSRLSRHDSESSRVAKRNAERLASIRNAGTRANPYRLDEEEEHPPMPGAFASTPPMSSFNSPPPMENQRDSRTGFRRSVSGMGSGSTRPRSERSDSGGTGTSSSTSGGGGSGFGSWIRDRWPRGGGGRE